MAAVRPPDPHGAGWVPDMVLRMYVGLVPAAGRSVSAAMIRLVESGRVAADGEPVLESLYHLAESGFG